MTVLHRTTLVALCGVAALSVPLGADEGWVVERFDARISLQPTGEFKALEAIDVDFRGEARHGIYRELRYQMNYDGTRVRTYGIALVGVTSADGKKLRVDTSTIGSIYRFRIGDPDRTISGKATYRLAYTVAGAMNAFPDHRRARLERDGRELARAHPVHVGGGRGAGGRRHAGRLLPGPARLDGTL